MARRPRSAVVATAVVLLVLSTAACGAWVAPSASTTPHGSPGPAGSALSAAVLARVRQSPLAWMISSGALSRLAAAGLPPALLAAYFDRSSTIVLGGNGAPDPLVPNASPAADFTSASALAAALDHHRVPTSVHLLVLDIEAWPLTPRAEQRAPIEAARRALAAATASGKRLVFTPAVDLVPVLLGRRLAGEALSGAYDRLLAGPGADVGSELEVQAQSTEGTPAASTFAVRARAAAEQAQPGEPVLVGLSTNPGGRRVPPADLLTLVHDTPGAAGYWLNVPRAGVACPRCGQPQPQVGVAFLEELAGMRPRSQGSAMAKSLSPGSRRPNRVTSVPASPSITTSPAASVSGIVTASVRMASNVDRVRATVTEASGSARET